MEHSKTSETQQKSFSFEGKWDDFIKFLKEKNLFPQLGDMSFNIGNINISYKRDSQNAVNTALTANIEEKAKKWICPRIPTFITPDILTAIGVIGILASSAGFVLGFFNRLYIILIPVGLIINWFGDSFDGSIARYRKKTRPHYGYYIDKIVDAFVVLIMALGIGLSGFVKIEIALIFACMYLLLMLNVDLKVYVKNECKNSFGIFGPTEVRILGIFLSIYMYFAPIHYYSVLGHFLTQYDIFVAAAGIGMLVIAIVDVIRTGILLNREDTKDW